MDEDDVTKTTETTKSNAATVSENAFSGIPLGQLISSPIIAAAKGLEGLVMADVKRCTEEK